MHILAYGCGTTMNQTCMFSGFQTFAPVRARLQFFDLALPVEETRDVVDVVEKHMQFIGDLTGVQWRMSVQ